MAKDFVPYRTIRYFYNDGARTDKFKYIDWKNKKERLIGTLVYTDDNHILFSEFDSNNKSIMLPESIATQSKKYFYCNNWMNQKEIKWMIKNQPFDIDTAKYGYSNGVNISKKFFRKLIIEIRDAKIDIIKNKINLDEGKNWISEAGVTVRYGWRSV